MVFFSNSICLSPFSFHLISHSSGPVHQSYWCKNFQRQGTLLVSDQQYQSTEWFSKLHTKANVGWWDTVGAAVQLVEYRTRNREVAGSTHTRSTASNLEQVAYLLCAQANSASYPQRDGKWVVATATGWRPSVADWGDGVSASCNVGRGSNCPLARAMDGHIMCCGTIDSCQSAATSKIVKRCWSRVWLM